MSHVKTPADAARIQDRGASRALARIALGSTHRTLREGVRLGLIVAVCTWTWLALVDAIAGQPFRTFDVLGGIGFFTAVHILLNLAYALALLSIVHGAAREPALIFALIFGGIMMQFAFAMASAMLSHVLGGVAWVLIFGGSVIGAAIAFVLLARTHPLAAELREAEAET